MFDARSSVAPLQSGAIVILFFLRFVLGVLIFGTSSALLMARRIGVRVLTFRSALVQNCSVPCAATRNTASAPCRSAGYVKMAGENPDDVRTGASDDSCRSRNGSDSVLVMGPVMNLALAVLVMAIVLYQGAPAPAFEQQP